MTTTKNNLSVETIIFSDTIPERIQSLLPELKKIYSYAFEAPQETNWVRLYLMRGEKTTLTIFSKDKNIIGFSCAGIQHYKVNNKNHAIFNAGVYTQPGKGLGNRIVLHGLMQAVEYKLIHPSQDLAYITDAATPASYALLLSNAHKCYPHPELDMPGYINELLKAYIKKNKLIVVDKENLIIKYPYHRSKHNPEKSQYSKSLKDNKYYQYYLLKNPSFINGETALLYIPLNFENIVRNTVICTKKILNTNLDKIILNMKENKQA